MKRLLFVVITMFLLCNTKAQTSKESRSPTYDIEINGVYYDVISINELTLCAVGMVDETATTLEIPGTIAYGDRVFNVIKVDFPNSCPEVRSLVLPNNLEYLHIDGCGVEELYLSAKVIRGFFNCPRLKRLRFSANTEQITSSNVGSLNNMAFAHCNLDELVFEDGNTILEIIRYVFYDSQIDSVYCGRNFYAVGTYPDFNMNGFRGHINAISFGPCVTRIESSTIMYVKRLDVPENIIEIFGYGGNTSFPNLEEINIFSESVYWNCNGYSSTMLSNAPSLKKVYINTERLGRFVNDMKCEELVIGPHITEGGYGISVRGNNAMVKVLNRIPPAATQFSNDTYLFTPLYIPRGSLSVYQGVDGWRNFFNFVEYDWDYYSINVLTNNPVYGSVDGGGVYNYGESVTLTAYPNNNCRFLNWTENGEVVCTERIYTFMVETDRRLTANFEIGSSVNICANSNNPEYGMIEGAGGYSFGETVTLKAFPNSGCFFQNWTENGLVVCSETTYSFVAENDRMLIANFVGTGVDENEELTKAFVFVEDNTIFVENVDELAEVTVFNVQGQGIYKGLGRMISVPSSGLYIVAVKNKKIKVLVE